MTIIVTMKDGQVLAFKDALYGYEGGPDGHLTIRHKDPVGKGQTAEGKEIDLWRFLGVINKTEFRNVEFKE